MSCQQSMSVKQFAGGHIDGRCSLGPRIVQGHMNGGTQSGADAGYLPNLVYGGLLESLDRAEVAQQRLAPDFTQPGDVIQHAGGHRLGAPLAVERDGEPVGFVAHPLQEVQTLTGAGKDHRKLLTGEPDLLEALGQAYQRYVVDPQLRQRALGGVDLRKAPVDDDEAGWVSEPSRTAGVRVHCHALDITGFDPV